MACEIGQHFIILAPGKKQAEKLFLVASTKKMSQLIGAKVVVN